MKRYDQRCWLLGLLLLAAISASCSRTGVEQEASTCVFADTKPGTQAVQGSPTVLVQYARSGTQSRAELARAVTEKYGLALIKPGNPYIPDTVRAPVNADLQALLIALGRDPRLSYAERNHPVYPAALSDALPDDPLAEAQWSLSAFGVHNAWAALREKPSEKEVTVAVVDTGVDDTHPDLKGKLAQGCDLYDADDETRPGKSRLAGHGTHVAGIIGAVRDNGIGVAGVASRVKLVPVKVFNDAGDASDVATLAKGILWAAGLEVPGFGLNSRPAQIINVSLGAEDKSSTLREAVIAAQNAGALVVVSSGNDGRSDGITPPANAPEVLAVGAVDRAGVRTEFSNYSAEGRSVDLVAPGGEPGSCPDQMVLSTLPKGVTGLQPGYGCLEGTSVAAAFVSGVAALVLSVEPDLSAQALKQRLLASTRTGANQPASRYGAGVLCADAAVGASTLCGQRRHYRP